MGKRMSLNVPYVAQPPNLGWCPAASAAMVLKWYGERISQEKIAKEMPVYKEGAELNKLGEYFIRKGYDVVIKFWLPGLRPSARGLSGDKGNSKLAKELLYGENQYQNQNTQILCGILAKFIESGGSVILEPPHLRDIQSELARKRPIIFTIDANWLRKTGRVLSKHIVVVKGLRNFSRSRPGALPKIIIHDPSDRPNMICRFDEFLYACYIGDGCAIFIKPRF